jgi:hypothetical protein
MDSVDNEHIIYTEELLLAKKIADQLVGYKLNKALSILSDVKMFLIESSTISAF